MGKPIPGSKDALSAMEITAEMAGLDAASKQILRHKEVLAVIAQNVIEEYAGYSTEEIMDFIEADSISSPEVSRGRTNTVIHGDAAEFEELHEKTSTFDVLFQMKNPHLSNDKVSVNLHVDVEPQKDYRPGYPIEKRGIYYLARSLGSQLNLLTEQTDYSQLEKCYSIWICRDNIPLKERHSISYYRMENYKNTGNCQPETKDYDLLHLVIIRLGDKDYSTAETDILDFLTALFYPHRADFKKTIGKYIDFKQNLKLEQEVQNMGGLGQSVLEEGIEKGIEQGIGMGSFLTLCSLVKDGLLKLEDAAKRANLSEAAFSEKMSKLPKA